MADPKLIVSQLQFGEQIYELKDKAGREAITGAQEAITGAQEAITGLQEAITGIKETLTGGIIQTVNGISGTDVVLTGEDIALDKSTGTSIATYLTNRDEVIAGAFNDLNTALTGANTQIGAVSGTVNSLSGTVNSLSGTVNSLSGTVSGVGVKVDEVSGTVSSLSGTVNTLSGTVDNLSGTVSGVGVKVDEVSGTVSSLSGTVNTLSGTVDNLSGTVNNLSGTVDTLKTAMNVSGSVQAGQYVTNVTQENGVISVTKGGITSSDVTRTATEGITGTTVEEALTQLDSKINMANSGSLVTMVSGVPGSEDDDYNTVLKRYTFSQNGNTIGTINIPKDLVVTAGEVVVAGDGQNDTENISGATAGDKYLKLTIANQTAPVYINVKDLVDVYTVETGATEVQLALSNSNELSATLVSGSVAKSKLASDVQTSLGKADTAIQTINGVPADKTGFTGAVTIYGTDIALNYSNNTSLSQAITGVQADITRMTGATGTVLTSVSYVTGSEQLTFSSATIGSLLS